MNENIITIFFHFRKDAPKYGLEYKSFYTVL